MRWVTVSGLKEAALQEQDCKRFTQEPAQLSFSFSAPTSRRRGRKQPPLIASLTLSRPQGQAGSAKGLLSLVTSFALFQGRDAGLRRTFNSIDLDGKGHITQKDLEAFASRNGLPGSYATHFANAVRANAEQAGAAGGGRQGQQRGQPPEEDAELTFAMFRQFVRSREEALRRAFNLFDQDGDGRISVGDLDASLSRVAVCCPQTRCIYRCPTHMAKQLHSKAAAEHGFIGFSDFRDFFLLLPQQDMLVEYWVAAGAAPELSDKVSISRTADVAGAKGSPWGHLLAGAVAGATSRTATAPLETLRLAAMAGQLQSRSLAQAASDIVSSQGWQGLYRGNLLNVLRSAPQKALDFFAFDAFKRIIGDDTHVQTFLAAGLAGCTSWVALYPLEVVRSRITVAAAAAATAAASSPHRVLASATTAAAAAAGQSQGLLGALSAIVRQEGPGALYKGLGPSVAAIFPEAAITYGLHDALKKAYTRVAHREPGVAPSLAFGVLSAFMGQLVSFPLETVSRRLQVAGVQGAASAAGAGASSAAAAAGGLAGAAAVVRALLAEGGPAALYRGIGAATLRLVPMACVSFGTYEAVRALIVAWEQQREDDQVKAMLHSRCVPLVLQGPDGGQEVVGRLCAPLGSKAPSLCGAVNGAGCAGGPALQLEPVATLPAQPQAGAQQPPPQQELSAVVAPIACSACLAASEQGLPARSESSAPCGAAESGAAVPVPPLVSPAGGPCGGGCGRGGVSALPAVIPACPVVAGACGCPSSASACLTLKV